MLRRLAFFLAVLPAAALADPPPAALPLDAITVTHKPPPGPAPGTVTPISIGHPHSCVENYPAAAIRSGSEGTTLLTFTITAQGTVSNIAVGKSSGDADLDTASAACASAWLYKPATKDGVAIDKPWQANVVWRLPLIPAELFQPCTHFATVTPDMLKSIYGRSSIGFLLMPDGTVKPTRIFIPSGNADLDQAALRCVGTRHYDASLRKVPSEGLPEAVTIDWNMELAVAPDAGSSLSLLSAPYPTDVVPPRATNAHSSCAAELPGVPSPSNRPGPTAMVITIAKDGSVRDATVLRSSGDDDADKAAIRCVVKWTYSPATSHGAPLAVRWPVKVNWKEL